MLDHVRRSSVGVMIRIFIIWKREIIISLVDGGHGGVNRGSEVVIGGCY